MNLQSIWRLGITILLLGLLAYKFPSKVMEILTLAAILVALFKEYLFSFYLPPRLIISASTYAEHFHEAEALNQQTGQFVENQAWFGVIVENRGIGIANNVEMIFNGIESNRVRNFGRFRSIPLRRSWVQALVHQTLYLE